MDAHSVFWRKKQIRLRTDFNKIFARFKQANRFLKLSRENFAQGRFRSIATGEPDDFWRTPMFFEQLREISVLCDQHHIQFSGFGENLLILRVTEPDVPDRQRLDVKSFCEP